MHTVLKNKQVAEFMTLFYIVQIVVSNTLLTCSWAGRT